MLTPVLGGANLLIQLCHNLCYYWKFDNLYILLTFTQFMECIFVDFLKAYIEIMGDFFRLVCNLGQSLGWLFCPHCSEAWSLERQRWNEFLTLIWKKGIKYRDNIQCKVLRAYLRIFSPLTNLSKFETCLG